MPAVEQSPVSTAAIAAPRGAWVIFDELKHRMTGRYVARKFYIGQVFTFDAGEELRADTIAELRKLLPARLVNVGRQESDDHTVVETWA